jgi:cell division septation protein DedD
MNRLGFVLYILWAAAAAAAQSLPSNWSFAHPDATALIGIDVRILRESAAGQSFGSEFEKSGLGMVHFPGMELLKEVDQVFLSSPGAKAVRKNENPPFLIAVTGHFAAEHLRQVLHGPHKIYRGVNIYTSGEGAKATNLAALDERTILAGDPVSLRGAIDRRSQRAAAPNALRERAAALAAANDFWLIATLSPEDFKAANAQFAPMASEINGLETGISVHDGFNLEMNLATRSPETAVMLSELVSTQVRQATAGKLDNQQAAEFLRALRIDSEGDRMRVKLALTKEEMERQIKTIQTARAAATAPKPQPKPKVEDNAPKTIKIFGLDDGVREIPLSPK